MKLQYTKNHIIQLDGLRFFAILMVMFAHFAQWQFDSIVIRSFPFVYGVTLFFVLSGFLITRILIENKAKYEEAGRPKKSLIKAFYIRRFLRIFPVYYLTIFVLLAISLPNIREYFWWLVTYTINILQTVENAHPENFQHFWSLAVEEQFYLIWPWLMLFVSRKHLEKVIIATIFIALSSKLLFFFMNWGWLANSSFTINCMHALGLGALVAYWSMYRKGFFEKLASPVITYSVIAFYALYLFVQTYFDIQILNVVFNEFFFAVGSAVIIIRASQNRFRYLGKAILENRFVTYSGKISYGIYIFHLYVPALSLFLSKELGIRVENRVALFIYQYFLAFLLAHLSWKYFENPINSLKSRFPYFKKKELAEPVPVIKK